MDYISLGKRIREERLRQHLTQAQLANDISISETYMGSIERGERCVPLDTLVRIVERLDVTVDYLLSDSLSISDSNIMIQIEQILNDQPIERKQMAVEVLRTLFSCLKDEKR